MTAGSGGGFLPLPLGRPGLRFGGGALGSTAGMTGVNEEENKEIEATRTLHNRRSGVWWDVRDGIFHGDFLGTCGERCWTDEINKNKGDDIF